MKYTKDLLNEFALIVFVILITVNVVQAIDPAKEYILTPDSIGWDYEELLVKTSDGFELNTWIYAPSQEHNNNTVIVLAYPDAGNMSYFVQSAWVLAYYGYTVVTFDYRGFGKSSPFPIEKDYLYHTEFSEDLISVVEMTKNKFPDQTIGVWGLSMGTTITTLSFNEIKSNIDFIIGEGFVTDTTKLVARIKDQKDKVVSLPYDKVDYQSIIQKIDVPILILAATLDTVTTLDDAHALKKVLGENCRVVEYEGEHLRGSTAWGKPFMRGYLDHINNFLDSFL